MVESSPELALIEAILGHEFRDKSVLSTALTHPSYLAQGRQSKASYERLEFLGDRVLGLAISENLFTRYPNAPPKELSQRLNELVRAETCAAVAEKLGLWPHVRTASSEQGNAARGRVSILADVIEALLGALYLDAGPQVAREKVLEWWQPLLQVPEQEARDPKSMLQEWAQARGLPLPQYQMIERIGPDHAPEFVIEVVVKGMAPGRGSSTNKRSAERMAAKNLMQEIVKKENKKNG